MNLTQLRTAQWLSIIGAVAGVLSLLALWESPFRTPIMAATVVLTLLFFVLEIHRDRLSILFAGIIAFHRSFPQQKNADVFRQVETEYCYLGIGFTTVMNIFRAWYETERKGNVRIRLLLTDPDCSEALEFQARYEHAIFKPDVSPEERKLLDDTARRGRDSIVLALDLLATLPSLSSAVEVRFHREKIRKWVHFINGNLLYVGVLRSGESGLNSPVMVLRPRNHWSLFDHYREEWESLWSSARSNTLAVKS